MPWRLAYFQQIRFQGVSLSYHLSGKHHPLWWLVVRHNHWPRVLGNFVVTSYHSASFHNHLLAWIVYTIHSTHILLIISNLYLITRWPGLCRNFDRQGLNMPPYQQNLMIMTELSINCDSWIWLDHIDQGLKRALVPLYLDLISPCSHYRQSHQTGLLEHFLRTGEASYSLALWKLPKIWSDYLKSWWKTDLEHGYKVMWFKGPSDVPRWGEAIPRAAFGETYVSSYPLAPIAYCLAIHLAQYISMLVLKSITHYNNAYPIAYRLAIPLAQ